MSDLSDQMGVLARQAQAWAEHAGEALRAAFGAPTERDRLANLISDAASAVDPGDPGSAHAVADAVLDAGYQRHGERADGPTLSKLRAEVEKLRDDAAPLCEIGPVTLNGWIAGSYVAAYDKVLDLIDKHIRASRRPADDQRP